MTPAVAAKIPDSWTLREPDPQWWRAPGLAESIEACRTATQHHAKSFYFASFPLPKYKRLGAFVVYAYCRYIDDVIDDAPSEELAPTEAFLRNELEDILQGGTRHSFAPALRQAVETFGIPIEFWHDLIHGCCLDRQPQRLQTYGELEMYCYYVASVVGLVMCCVFGVKEKAALPQAIEMGIALQLTNILRDVKEDWDMGRCYLPVEILEQYGLDYSNLESAQFTDDWERLMQNEIQRAWDFYAKGAAGLQAIPADGSRQCATIMARVYAGILDESTARKGNFFHGRVFVPFWKKCVLAIQALTRKNPFYGVIAGIRITRRH